MKSYEQLTDEQKELAIRAAITDLLNCVVEGSLRFSADSDLGKKIESAGAKANAMQTPWFFAEYVMDDCGEELRSIATATAVENVYSEPNDPYVVDGIC